MNLANLYYFIPEKKIGNVELFIVESEGIRKSYSTTEYPVADGFNITDHIVSEPFEVSLSCVFAEKISYTAIKKDKKEYLDELLALADKKETVVLITGLKVFDNMIITNLNFSRDKEINNGFYFDITLKQIRKAKLNFTEVSAIPNLTGTQNSKMLTKDTHTKLNTKTQIQEVEKKPESAIEKGFNKAVEKYKRKPTGAK